MSVEDEIRQVSDRFYAALNRIHNGDSEPMVEVWSQSSDVTATHPFGGRQVGWVRFEHRGSRPRSFGSVVIQPSENN